MVTNSDRHSAKEFFADPQPYLWNNPYVDFRADAVRRLLPRGDGLSVLDLGCGDGRISIPLTEHCRDLLLVDSSAGMLELARGNVPQSAANKVRYQCIDVDEFVSPRKYDVVLCIGVLAHVPSPMTTLRQIADLVRPGGCALVQLTDDEYCLGRLTHRVGDLWRRFAGRSEYETNHMNLASVCLELTNAGLKPTDHYRYVFVPGLRRLPSAIRRAVVRAVNSSFLSRRGGEVLALFTRL